VSEDDLLCPICGGPIAGVELWGGAFVDVLFWQCMSCGHMMHRWPEEHELRERAQHYMDDIKREREAGG